MAAETTFEFQIVGDPQDLEELLIALCESNPRPVKHESEYFLRVVWPGDDVIEARRHAREYVSRLKGAASLIIPQGCRPVTLREEEWYWIDESDRRIRGAGGIEWVSAQSYFRIGRNLDDEHQNRLRRRLRIVLSECEGAGTEDVKLRHILQIMSKPSPSWSELYLAQELAWGIMSSMGVHTEFTEDIKHFKYTACSWSALGIEARHGNKPEKEELSRENAMSYDDAFALVREYVKTLLEEIDKANLG
jgi:hypothetical protein